MQPSLTFGQQCVKIGLVPSFAYSCPILKLEEVLYPLDNCVIRCNARRLA